MPKQKLLGIFWILFSMLSFSITMCIAKFLHTNVPVAVKVFMRLFFGLILVAPLAYLHIKSLKIKNPTLYLFRASLVCGSMLCTYYSYSHLPLALATAIGFTSPLITTTLSILVLKEKVNLPHWLILIVGYAGILIMIKIHTLVFNLAILVAFLANILASSAVMTAKKLSKTQSSEQILFYTNLLSLIFVCAPAFHFWRTPGQMELILLCLLGGTGVFSQYCYLRAITYEKISFLVSFEYMRLVFSIPIGFLLFQESPSSHTIFGSGLIIMANMLLVYKK